MFKKNMLQQHNMICTVSALGWTLRKTWTKKHPWFCRQTVGLDHITRVHRRFRGGKKIDSKLTNNSRGRSKELWCVKPSSQVVSWNFLPYFYLNPPRLWNLSTKNRPGVWRVKLDTQPINKMFFKIYFIQIWKKKHKTWTFVGLDVPYSLAAGVHFEFVSWWCLAHS